MAAPRLESVLLLGLVLLTTSSCAVQTSMRRGGGPEIADWSLYESSRFRVFSSLPPSDAEALTRELELTLSELAWALPVSGPHPKSKIEVIARWAALTPFDLEDEDAPGTRLGPRRMEFHLPEFDELRQERRIARDWLRRVVGAWVADSLAPHGPRWLRQAIEEYAWAVRPEASGTQSLIGLGELQVGPFESRQPLSWEALWLWPVTCDRGPLAGTCRRLALAMLLSLIQHGDGDLSWLARGADAPPLDADALRARIACEPTVCLVPVLEALAGSARIKVGKPAPERSVVVTRTLLRQVPGGVEAIIAAHPQGVSETRADDALPASRSSAVGAERVALLSTRVIDAPEDGEAWLALGLVLQGAEAGPPLEKAVELLPGNPGAFAFRALWLVEQDRADEALELARRALALDAANVPARLALSAAHGRLGDCEGASLAHRAAFASMARRPDALLVGRLQARAFVWVAGCTSPARPVVEAPP